MAPQLDTVAPAFIEMAHRIVWCVVGTSSPGGRPTTRVLHPVWEWDGTRLTGWIATSPLSPKAKDIAANPFISLTYWSPNHDTCSARGDAAWETSDAEREAGWQRFLHAPAPVGYDPAIVPGWDSPTSPRFGILRVTPTYLRVMPGSAMVGGPGEIVIWRA
jgi:general stress protein 26